MLTTRSGSLGEVGAMVKKEAVGGLQDQHGVCVCVCGPGNSTQADMIGCDGCGHRFHPRCQGMSMTKYYHTVLGLDNTEPFVCGKCKELVRVIIATSHRTFMAPSNQPNPRCVRFFLTVAGTVQGVSPTTSSNPRATKKVKVRAQSPVHPPLTHRAALRGGRGAQLTRRLVRAAAGGKAGKETRRG